MRPKGRPPTCSTTSCALCWEASACWKRYAAALRRGKLSRSNLFGENCSWLQEFGLFDAEQVYGTGLPTSILSNPGLGGTLMPNFQLPTVKSQGPQGEMENLPLQVEFSSLEIKPRHSGDPVGAAPMSWSAFGTQEY